MRYIVTFNNGSPTDPNVVSKFILTAHVVPVVATKHSPAERRERESEIMPPFIHFRSPTPARTQVLSRTTNFAVRKFSSGNVVYKCHANARQKNGALRALLSLKRANISAFCLCDRAAGRQRFAFAR